MTAPRSGRPGPDGHHDDLSDDDIAGLSLVVPRDARELTADRDQWLRETADTRGSQRRRLAVTAAIVLTSLVVVTASGFIGSFVRPAPTSPPASAPLAVVGQTPGAIGGLLPDVVLAEGDAAVAARSLRPAVVALVPSACDQCEAVLRQVRQQAVEYGMELTLVASVGQSGQLSAIARSLGGVRVRALADSSGMFVQPFGPTLLTLLLVRDDGVVVDIVRNPPREVRLESALVGLPSDFGA
ncbi:MAG: hypothetical protein ABI586_07115 [Candidatus Nanopelagicales bacterium]